MVLKPLPINLKDVPYVIKHIKHILEIINITDSSSVERFIRRDLPYVLQCSDDGTIIPLNRYYKPLGIKDIGVRVNYKEVTLYNIDAELVALPKHDGIPISKEYFLYGDDYYPVMDKQRLTQYINVLRNVFKLDKYCV